MTKLKYKLLDDNTVDLTVAEQDLLNHVQYADFLSNLVKEKATNNTIEAIALTGNWGIGKTSIINAFTKKISNELLNGKKVRAKIYNAWKYSKDDFRKEFLLDVVEDKADRIKLEKKIYSEESQVKHTYINNSKKSLLFGLVIIVAIGIIFLCYKMFGFVITNKWLTILFNTFNLSLATVCVYSIKLIISTRTITTINSFSTHDFSVEFNSIIGKTNKFNIFIIDDLDRCKPEHAIDILEIIQGYLKEDTNDKNYIFIIPIDLERLKSYLKKINGYNNDELVLQYFNKIFDINVDIKSIGRLNLYKMLEKIDLKYKFGFSKKGLSSIADYLVRTPRDIKKHLNNINIKRMLLKGNDNKLTLADDQIIKLYILKTNWGMLYNKLLSEYKSNENLNEYLKEEVEQCDDDLLKKFISCTQSISIGNIAEYEYENSEIAVDNQIFTSIYNCNYQYISTLINSEGRIKKVWDCLDYMFRVHIVERKEEREYIWPILRVYLWLINNTVNHEYQSSYNITLHDLMLNVVSAHNKFSADDLDSESYKEIWERTYNSILKYFELYSSTHIDDVSIIVDKLIEINQNKALCMILELDNKKNIIPDEVRKSVMKHLISNAADEVYLGRAVSTKDIDTITDKNIVELADKDNRKAIIAVAKSIPELIAKNANNIINSIHPELIVNDINYLDKSQENKALKDIKYLTELINADGTDIDVAIKGYIEKESIDCVYLMQTLLGKSYQEKKYKLIVYRISKLIVLICCKINDFSIYHDYFKILNSHNYIEFARKLYKYIDDDKQRAALIVANLGLYNFDEKSCNVLFDEIEFNDSIKLYLNDIKVMLEEAREITTTVGTFNQINFNYNYSLNYFIGNSWKLTEDMFLASIKGLSFNQIIDNGELCKRLNHNFKVAKLTINKVTSFLDCTKLYEYLEHKKYKKEYHEIVKFIIDNATNVSDLKEIHDCDQTDSYELNCIKKKMQKDFPESIDKELFNRIVWS